MRYVKNIEISVNDSGQRIDRFLKKMLPNAGLGQIYKIIRKDLKLNGKRAKQDTWLRQGDRIQLFINDENLAVLMKKKPVSSGAKRRFTIIYEDEQMLIVDKPAGLLTHGDAKEKKNHLTNQVIDYFIESGIYNPADELTFRPAPSNRLDRNTAGLVVFAKNAPTMRTINSAFQLRQAVDKRYLAILCGRLEGEMKLVDEIVKDRDKNKVSIVGDDRLSDDNPVLDIATVVRPLAYGDYEDNLYTLAEIELLTGRTHQIRIHCSSIGHPILGDSKYEGRKIEPLKVRSQLLWGYKLILGNELMAGGREFTSGTNPQFKTVAERIFGKAPIERIIDFK